MANDDDFAGSIRAFFDADENKNLFRTCPWRPDLSCLHEFNAKSVENILMHMLGHILDYRAGQSQDTGMGQTVKAIDQNGIDDELRTIYNDFHNVALNEARQFEPGLLSYAKPEYRGFGPEQNGCFGADAQAELMAEAIRAYMQDPNYLKTVAPNVAKRIRAFVNVHSELKYIIQFN